MKFQMKIFILLLLVILSETQKVTAQSTGVTALQKGFKDPPLTARPKALWPWVNGNVSFSQITYEMEEAKRKGMGGFDIWDIDRKLKSNIARLPNAWSKPFAEAPLLDAGLIGPVIINYAVPLNP
jgi:hypothetical protein